jgi:hypothetical protein
MAVPAKTRMTLSESMRDDAKRLRDVLSDGFNRLFADAKTTTPPLASSAISEEPGAVFDAHVRAEFVEQSVDATMATMTDAPYVTHVPVMTGGYGRDEVRQFYATWFIGRWPADVQITPISRTVGQGRVIDELIVSFTHDIEMPALLPGIAPTGRKVILPHVVVVGIVNGNQTRAGWLEPRRLRRGRERRHRRPHLPGCSRAPGAPMDVGERPQRRLSPGDARLRADTRGCDGGIREELAEGMTLRRMYRRNALATVGQNRVASPLGPVAKIHSALAGHSRQPSRQRLRGGG